MFDSTRLHSPPRKQITTSEVGLGVIGTDNFFLETLVVDVNRWIYSSTHPSIQHITPSSILTTTEHCIRWREYPCVNYLSLHTPTD